MTTDTTTDAEMCDDPETCRRGRVWLAWYAGGLVAVMFVATLIGGAVTQGQKQATEFAYARDDAAVAMAQTFADSLPRGY
jgi:hypothetical protein